MCCTRSVGCTENQNHLPLYREILSLHKHTCSVYIVEFMGVLECLIVIVLMLQLWDWLFRSCELNGRILLREGLITVEDIEECVVKGKSNKLIIMLPAYCILQCLLRSANSDSPGLLISMSFTLSIIVLSSVQVMIFANC